MSTNDRTVQSMNEAADQAGLISINERPRPSPTAGRRFAAAPAARLATSTAGRMPVDGRGRPCPAGPQWRDPAATQERSGSCCRSIILAALGGGGYEGYRWFTVGRFLVSTDDAYVKADMSTHRRQGRRLRVDGADRAEPASRQGRRARDDRRRRLPDRGRCGQDAHRHAGRHHRPHRPTGRRPGRDDRSGQGERCCPPRPNRSRRRPNTTAPSRWCRARSARSSASIRRWPTATAPLRPWRAPTRRSRRPKPISTCSRRSRSRPRRRGASWRRRSPRRERDLDFATVRAPFDGVVGNKAVQPGQYVQTGTRLLALVPLDSAYVEANFKETQIDRLQPGQKVTIKPDAFSAACDRGHASRASRRPPAPSSRMLPPENATGNFTKIVQRLPVRINIPSRSGRRGLPAARPVGRGGGAYPRRKPAAAVAAERARARRVRGEPDETREALTDGRRCRRSSRLSRGMPSRPAKRAAAALGTRCGSWPSSPWCSGCSWRSWTSRSSRPRCPRSRPGCRPARKRSPGCRPPI